LGSGRKKKGKKRVSPYSLVREAEKEKGGKTRKKFG